MCVCREGRIWRKGIANFHAVTWQKISRNARQTAAQHNQQCREEDRAHNIEPNKRVAQAESKNLYWNQKCGPIFLVTFKAQILCFAGLYAQLDRRANTWPDESFFKFLLSAPVTKTGGRTRHWWLTSQFWLAQPGWALVSVGCSRKGSKPSCFGVQYIIHPCKKGITKF